MRGVEIALFLVCFSAALALLSASGYYDAVGHSLDDGGQFGERTQEIKEQTDINISQKEESGSSWITGWRTAVQGLNQFVSVIFALYPFLVNIGFPKWLAAFVTLPFYSITALLVYQLLRGIRVERR